MRTRRSLSRNRRFLVMIIWKTFCGTQRIVDTVMLRALEWDQISVNNYRMSFQGIVRYFTHCEIFWSFFKFSVHGWKSISGFCYRRSNRWYAAFSVTSTHFTGTRIAIIIGIKDIRLQQYFVLYVIFKFLVMDYGFQV